MFDKAASLLQQQNFVTPKPGAQDGSYIVAGHSNQIYCVTPGKGGSLKCDQKCPNTTTKICEHTLAVAEKRGSLNDFITWFKRSKAGPSVTKMALNAGPKSAGKKTKLQKKIQQQKGASNRNR
jgi:hypothetical protein